MSKEQPKYIRVAGQVYKLAEEHVAAVKLSVDQSVLDKVYRLAGGGLAEVQQLNQLVAEYKKLSGKTIILALKSSSSNASPVIEKQGDLIGLFMKIEKLLGAVIKKQFDIKNETGILLKRQD